MLASEQDMRATARETTVGMLWVVFLISATYLVVDAMSDRVRTCGGFDCAEIDRASMVRVSRPPQVGRTERFGTYLKTSRAW